LRYDAGLAFSLTFILRTTPSWCTFAVVTAGGGVNDDGGSSRGLFFFPSRVLFAGEELLIEEGDKTVVVLVGVVGCRGVL